MAGTVICDYINSANVSGGFLGIGQTWQTVTASRALNVTYTNSTGKPITLSIIGDKNSCSITLIVDGVVVAHQGTMASGYGYGFCTVTGVVKNGGTYSILGSELTMSNVIWMELR